MFIVTERTSHSVLGGQDDLRKRWERIELKRVWYFNIEGNYWPQRSSRWKIFFARYWCKVNRPDQRAKWQIENNTRKTMSSLWTNFCHQSLTIVCWHAEAALIIWNTIVVFPLSIHYSERNVKIESINETCFRPEQRSIQAIVRETPSSNCLDEGWKPSILEFLLFRQN